MSDLGRGVLVTGASRGIGAAVARAFAEQGDRVAIHYRAEKDLAEALRDGLPGSGHRVVQADLSDPDAVRGLVDEAWVTMQGLDVVVNNAGISPPHAPLATTWTRWRQAWEDTLAVNLVGPAHVMFCAARLMVDRGAGGRIVNVGSRGAYRGEPDIPAYGASKAGLHSLGQSLAAALAPHGISVATVAPGFVGTDMTADLLDGPAGDAIRAQSPFGRVARPEEVAAAVVHLASPDALWSSGAVLDVNGASYFR